MSLSKLVGTIGASALIFGAGKFNLIESPQI